MPEITTGTTAVQLNAGGSNGLKSIAITNSGANNVWVSQRPSVTAGGATSGFLLIPGQNLAADNVAANLKLPWYAIGLVASQITMEEFY